MILSKTSSDSLSMRLRSAIFQSSCVIITIRSSKINAMNFKTNNILSKRGKYDANTTKYLGVGESGIHNGI